VGLWTRGAAQLSRGCRISPLISGALLGVYGAVFGVLIGALMGVLTQALTSRRRDLSAGTSVRAERYDILDAVADTGRLLSDQLLSPRQPEQVLVPASSTHTR
jgi:hypothetical protein